jgi:hypothetical protein
MSLMRYGQTIRVRALRIYAIVSWRITDVPLLGSDVVRSTAKAFRIYLQVFQKFR